jgi:hypothetical protein
MLLDNEIFSIGRQQQKWRDNYFKFMIDSPLEKPTHGGLRRGRDRDGRDRDDAGYFYLPRSTRCP